MTMSSSLCLVRSDEKITTSRRTVVTKKTGINAIFMGNAFFEKEDPFSRFMLGTLLLIVFLGLISWVVMMIYNLDAVSPFS